jgi:4-amino-4-deoxy-L-arabinose transferase-like glycosyltransferase
MAGAEELFGPGEFSLRLPAAIFGWLLVPLGFVVVRRYFGHAAAITAAILIAVSQWEVELSRTARMYTPFAFFFTLSLYGICRGYVDKSHIWRWAAVPLAVLTVAMHTLGFTLGAAFALVAVAPRLNVAGRMAALASAAITAAWYLYWDPVAAAGFNRPRLLAVDAGGADAAQTVVGSSLSRILRRFYFPEDVLFLSPDAAARLTLVAGLLCGALLIFFLLRRTPDLRRPWSALFLVACVVAGIAQQFILTAVLFATFVFVQGRGLRVVTQPAALMVAAFLALLLIGWFLVGVTGESGDQLGVYETLRALFDYPRAEVIRPFVLARPFMLTLAGIGIAVTLHRASLERQLTAQALLAVTLVVVLVLHGIFESQFRTRYNFNLDVLFLTFVAAGAAQAVVFLLGHIRNRRPALRVPRPVIAVLPIVVALLICTPDLRPASAFASVQRWEGSPAEWARRHGFTWPVDRKSTAVYVRAHASPDDEVLSMDWLTSYYYAGRVDYWLRTSLYEDVSYRDGDRWRDMYLGAVVVPDDKALNEQLIPRCRNTLWIISSGWIMRYQDNKLSPEILRILDDLDPYLVHTGLDDISAVYRIPPTGDCPPARNDSS